MKSYLLRILFLYSVILSHTAHATADGPDHWMIHGVDQSDVLNIRQEPTFQSQKIGEIPADGKCIKNIKCIGGLTYQEFTSLSESDKAAINKQRPRWCQIEYKGIKGWVAGRYLREGGCLDAAE